LKSAGLYLVLPLVLLAAVGFYLRPIFAGQYKAESKEIVAARIAPVGQLTLTNAPVVKPVVEHVDPVLAEGKTVYEGGCNACHTEGLAGAPKVGEKPVWEPRLVKGIDSMVKNAVNGFAGSSGAMPPKGGRSELGDEQIRAAVTYMVHAIQGGGQAPTVVDATVVAAASGTAPVAGGAAPAAAPAPPAQDLGQETYQAVCFACHGSKPADGGIAKDGIAGAPKLGDKKAWQVRLRAGKAALEEHAVMGYQGNAGLMPPKGGRAELSDEAAKAAVGYLLDQAQ
jgi:cytochrome c5